MITHNTVNAHKDKSNDQDVKSQDKGDMGHGICPSGGFTSVVSIKLDLDNELKYVIDNLKGYCTVQLVGSPEEAVSP